MRTILAKVFLACGVWLLGGNAASAATTQFKVASGDWSNAANWSGGLPTPPNEAAVVSAAASPATAAINPGAALASGGRSTSGGTPGRWARSTSREVP